MRFLNSSTHRRSDDVRSFLDRAFWFVDVDFRTTPVSRVGHRTEKVLWLADLDSVIRNVNDAIAEILVQPEGFDIGSVYDRRLGGTFAAALVFFFVFFHGSYLVLIKNPARCLDQVASRRGDGRFL
jgi:hypothetical protein